MLSRDLQSRSALEGVAVPGRHGRQDGSAGVVLREVTGRGLVSVIPRKGQAGGLRERVAGIFGLELPEASELARGAPISFYWAGFQHWIASAEEAEAARLLPSLRAQLGDLASLSEQSDGRAIVLVTGGDARAALAKLVLIDLHPRAFAPGDTALTLIGQVSGQVTLIDPTPIFELMVFRSFAETVWRELLAAGAEFGVEITERR